MVATRRLRGLVSSALPTLELPDGPVMVALSGGADSAALAFLSLETGAATSAIHIDHGLPGSSAMARAAADVAGELGIELDVERVQVGDGPSLEDQARKARYDVLTARPSPVLTGHTRDDSVETILINLVRGTGAPGLAGIPRFRPPNIHRPMLALSRDETREIAALAGLSFAEDPMNDDMTLTRNRIRREILPLLRELNPRVDVAVARTAETIGRDSKYLDSLVAGLTDGRSVPVSVIVTLPRPLADRVLSGMLVAAGVGPTADRMERMWSVASGESDRQELARGRTVIRDGALLEIVG